MGGNRLGLLLTDVDKTKKRPIKEPYALAYLNTIDSTTPRWRSCLKNFIKLVSKKYKHKVFQLIVTKKMMDYLKGVETGDWFEDASLKNNQLIKLINKYYKKDRKSVV